MSKFTYTLPSGKTYTVIGPAAATSAESDYVFYSQVAAGALVGYQSGQTLAGTSLSTEVFSISRLQRGTAGVQSQPLLAVHKASDILSSVLNSIAGDQSGALTQTLKAMSSTGTITSTTGSLTAIQDALTTSPITTGDIVSILQNLPIVAAMPTLTDIPIANAITQADVIKAKGNRVTAPSIGSLSPIQVQSIQAQLTNLIDQPSTVMSSTTGIGKYGLTCYQLEKAGYVKPGTQARFIDPNPSAFISVMRSNTIWLGKDYVFSVDQILGDENLQNKIEEELLECGYKGLVAAGLISSTPMNAVQPVTSWTYQDGSLSTNGLSQVTPTGTTTPVGSLLSNAESGTLVSNQLNLQNYYYSQVQNSLSSTVQGEIGALMANASKFGPEVTAVWATSGGSTNFTKLMAAGYTASNQATASLNQYATSAISTGYSLNANPITTVTTSNPIAGYSNFGAAGLTAIPQNVTSSLTNQLAQISSSMNTTAKSSQFATGFASVTNNIGDLSTLNNLSYLTNTSLSNIADLPGSISSTIEGLANDAISSLDSVGTSVTNGIDTLTNVDLGSLANVGSLTGLVPGGLGDIVTSILDSIFGGTNALVSGIQQGIGYSDTINRSTLDAATSSIIGSAKIVAPTFTSGEATSGVKADISSAKKSLSTVGSSATPAITSLGAGSDAASLRAKYGA